LQGVEIVREERSNVAFLGKSLIFIRLRDFLINMKVSLEMKSRFADT
jgi:hypothetical protein